MTCNPVHGIVLLMHAQTMVTGLLYVHAQYNKSLILVMIGLCVKSKMAVRDDKMTGIYLQKFHSKNSIFHIKKCQKLPV